VQSIDAGTPEALAALAAAEETMKEAVRAELEIENDAHAAKAALAAAEASRSATADVQAAEREAQALEEESAAQYNTPGVDRGAVAAKLKASKLRLALAQQRSDRASKTQRDVRLGSSLLQRGTAAAKALKDAEEAERRLRRELEEEKLLAAAAAAATTAATAAGDVREDDTEEAISRVAKLEAALKVASAKVAASEEAANDALNETLAKSSGNALDENLNEAVKSTAAAVALLAQVLELSASNDLDVTAQVRYAFM
jgi:hypothetical protein